MTPLLFDLDGTLVDSRAVIERQWGALCERLGRDFAEVLKVLHGRRSADTIRAVAPHVDADAEAEAARLDASEAVDVDGLVPVAGAPDLLARLPAGSWGIVTSGPRELAERRLRAVGLPVPPAMVCGDEIERGKPNPEGFLAGARLLGVDPATCVAFEDAPAGVAAAVAAGITTTHPAFDLGAAGIVIDDLTGFDAALAVLGRGVPGEPDARRR